VEYKTSVEESGMNLFGLKEVIKARKAEKELREFRRGYNYAAGELLFYKANPNVVERLEVEAMSIDRTSFDSGMEAAMYDFNKMLKKGAVL
jgi:hypothetical protein